MFNKIKNWWQRRQDRKVIEHAFQMARSLFPNITQSNRWALYEAIRDLLDEYRFNWGEEDGVARFYYARLNEFWIIWLKEKDK